MPHIKLCKNGPCRVILSLDPGTSAKSFAWAITSKTKKDKETLVVSSMLRYPINDLTESSLAQQKLLFVKEMKSIIKTFNPTDIVAERYQVRGRFMGAASEKISFMLGILSTLYPKIDYHLIIASQWKNKFNQCFSANLDVLYKELKPIPPHIIDSCLIGYYQLNREKKNPFENWKAAMIRRLEKRW